MKKLGGLCAALAVALLAADGASARTLCVSKNNKNCFRTIQEGIHFAQFGDTVRIEPGVYTDTMQIPPLKQGLRIVGTKAVVVDAIFDGCLQDQPNDQHDPNPNANSCKVNNLDINKPQFPAAVVLNGAPGIHIYAHDVQIRGITIRGGVSHGILVQNGRQRVRIIDVAIEGPAATGILCGGTCDDLVISDVTITGAQTGVSVSGPRVVVDRVLVDGTTTGAGVVVNGVDAFVDRPEVLGVAGAGVQVTGDRASVIRADVDGATGLGVNVTGNQAWVAGNRTANTVGGVRVTGDAPIVEKNRVSSSTGSAAGIRVVCATCASGSVGRNRVEDVTGTGNGIELVASAAGLVAERNRVDRVAGAGVDLTGSTGAVVARNAVRDAGTTTEPCFRVAAASSLVERNKVQRCAGEGFIVTGAGNVLARNAAKDAGTDGFEVGPAASGTTLERNTAQSSQLYGFEVADGGTPATTTTLDRNRGTRSTLFDLCDEGVATTLSNNRFGSEAPVVQDGVRDCVQ